MVAALQSPPDVRLPDRLRPRRQVSARVVPLARQTRPARPAVAIGPAAPAVRRVARAHGASTVQAVHHPRRQPDPRATRSQRAVYRRRRIVAAALGLGVVLTAARAGAALGGSTTTAPERSPRVERVVAQPGDTLWTLAQRLDPGADPRAVVDQLASSLGTTTVEPGEVVTWER